MCAKKATSATAKKPAAKSASNSSTSKATTKSAENGVVPVASPAPTKSAAKSASAKTVPAKPAKASVSPERSLTSQHIGEVAGEIWQILSTSDGLTLAAVKKAIDAPADVVMAAVGWLGREGKIDFVISGRMLKIALKP